MNSTLFRYNNRYVAKFITSKISLNTLIIVAVSIIFFSCNKKESNPPLIYLEKSSGLVYQDIVTPAGTNFTIRLVAEMGDATITNIVIKNSHNGQVVDYFDTGVNNERIVISKILTKSVYSSETWTFMAIDKNGKNATVSFTVKLDTSVGFQNIRFIDGIILGAQKCSTTGSFLSLNSGNIWSQDAAFNVQDSIEMLYYYDSTGDANTIASPGANIGTYIYVGSTSPLYWLVRNETRYFKTTYTSADFVNIQNDSLLLVAYDEINGKRKAKNLVPGDVYAFKTTYPKYGMFVVDQVTGSDSGTIKFSIKMQK